ncbi:hypothetical protein [Nocardia alni]|uniref:hypothetical protein n=1 Tax=Nocardia alni TaxID=2815723 RepID=UPI001C22B5DF|nr:hypothetical protein [Nocardia alni]
MNRAPPCATTDCQGDARRCARQACDLASQLSRQGEQARRQASSIHATTAAILGREREQMHQYRIDAEITATERSIEYLLVPGREQYPDLAVLDPYLLAAADPLLLLGRLAEAALHGGSADRIVVQLFGPGVEIEVEAMAPASPFTRAAALAADATEPDSGGITRSMPMMTMTGRSLGFFSCYYDEPDARIEEDRQLFDLVASAAVKAVQWHGVRSRHRVERRAS